MFYHLGGLGATVSAAMVPHAAGCRTMEARNAGLAFSASCPRLTAGSEIDGLRPPVEKLLAMRENREHEFTVC